jgi:hypothetical protein
MLAHQVGNRHGRKVIGRGLESPWDPSPLSLDPLSVWRIFVKDPSEVKAARMLLFSSGTRQREHREV